MAYDIYYTATSDDFKHDPEFASSFGRDYQSYHTNNMPKVPIDPGVLALEVIGYLKQYDNVIADETVEQLKSFCRLFNFIVNFEKDSSPFKFIHAAQTGSAKSLSLKVYVSLLEEHSSLIVVSKVQEALAYCKFINQASKNENYARCFYSITDKNKDNPLRVDSNKLKDYRCIVISHAMFKVLNQSNSMDNYKLYDNKKRDLIVVDEKISFYDTTEVTYDEIHNLFQYFNHLIEGKNIENYDDQIFELIIYLFQYCKDELEDTNAEMSFLSFNSDIMENDLGITQERINRLFESVEPIVYERIDKLFKELHYFSKLTNKHYESSVYHDVEETIAKIKLILSGDFIYYKNNYEKSLIRIDNIVNKLGNCLILDGTANINEFYKIAYRYSSLTIDVTAKQIRKYSNLTIHKAKGYRQGRSSTFKMKTKAQVKEYAKIYISYLNTILTSKNDKLLIITHKGYKQFLMEECNDPRVQFTHWGDHIGKNDWSDCNKVMVIGWNFMNEKAHICNAFNAINNRDETGINVTSDVLKNFANTQLADDLVQGVMRSKARKIATKDADCEPTDVYLFYEDIKEYNDVLELFESQFPMCKVLEWKPKGIDLPKKRAKVKQKADMIINYLQSKESTDQNISLKDVLEELEINKSTASRIINGEYFKEELNKKGYKYKNSNGRTKYFILS